MMSSQIYFTLKGADTTQNSPSGGFETPEVIEHTLVYWFLSIYPTIRLYI